MFLLFIHTDIITQNQATGFALMYNSKTCEYYNLPPAKSTPLYCLHHINFFIFFYEIVTFCTLFIHTQIVRDWGCLNKRFSLTLEYHASKSVKTFFKTMNINK